MMNSRLLVVCASLVAVLMLSSAALARGGPGFQQGQGQGCPVLSSLTEEQQQELIKVTREHRETMYPKRQMMISKMAELQALLATDGADQSRVSELRNEMTSLNQELFQQKLDHRIEMSQKFGISTGKKGFYQGSQGSGKAGSPRGSGPRTAR